jgi:hypothetical protein
VPKIKKERKKAHYLRQEQWGHESVKHIVYTFLNGDSAAGFIYFALGTFCALALNFGLSLPFRSRRNMSK